MGQVLSAPVSSQYLQRTGDANFQVGSTEMQGFRMSMEDALTITLKLPHHPQISFFGVYDGHAGDKCSQFLEEKMHLYVDECEDPLNHEQLAAAVCKADADFCSDPKMREHGSTCCFALVKEIAPNADGSKRWQVTVSNTGDSRALLIRVDGSYVEMTSDHKPDLPLERERIISARGTVQANRVDGQLAMSRAMGDFSYKGNQSLPPHLQKVIPNPDITTETAYSGDSLLVCCDGIVEQLTSEQVANFVHRQMQELPPGADSASASAAGDAASPSAPSASSANSDSASGTAARSASPAPSSKASPAVTHPMDPAMVCAQLLEYSIEAGSKDNHSAMLIRFNRDGQSYCRKPEFVAGPFTPFQHDRQFSKAYLADAKRRGFEPEAAIELAKETEAKNPPIEIREPPGNGPDNLRALLNHISGNGASEEQMMGALTSMMFQSMEGDGDIEEGGDEGEREYFSSMRGRVDIDDDEDDDDNEDDDDDEDDEDAHDDEEDGNDQGSSGNKGGAQIEVIEDEQ